MGQLIKLPDNDVSVKGEIYPLYLSYEHSSHCLVQSCTVHINGGSHR